MSLTSNLDQKDSPISLWMRARFPLANRKIVGQSCRATLQSAKTLLPPGTYGGSDYGLIGTALDFRLRLFFDEPFEAGVARGGAFLACHGLEATPEGAPSRPARMPAAVAKAFFADLDAAVARIAPAKRLPEAEGEEELARFCVVLAWWEQVFRTRAAYESRLWTPGAAQTTAELLGRVDAAFVADVSALSRLFWENCADLLTSTPIYLNPGFEGSLWVGGADADFIAGGCLWDIKATIRAEFQGEWLYQLLGYVLLDASDQYKIREVGIYLARQGVRLRWTLDELLPMMTGDASVSLAELRRDFAAAVTPKELL